MDETDPQPPAAGAEQILIVDDSPANLDVLTRLLEPQGYRILAASSGSLALRIAERAQPNLILLDVLMPEMDGYETCRQLKSGAATREIPVLFISARDETASLVAGFRAGGVDYIAKPFDADEVLVRVQTRLQLSRLRRELQRKNAELVRVNDELRREVGQRERAEQALAAADEQLSIISDLEAQRWGLPGFVGRSNTVSRIVQDIRRMHQFGSVNVLITGESGTGKELVARAVHFGSGRARQPFIAVNCVAIPEDLAESTLFGHMRGAFTGATADKKGYFDLAAGGTLFLDEIGDMPANLQAKLLRVLEDGCFTPVGATKERHADVRIVAATNADLQQQITAGGFRRDLYFRLAQFTVHLPPLRQRTEDIPLLAQHFLRLFATEMGMPTPAMSQDAMEALVAHSFPGNIRELKNVIERSLIESGGAAIELRHVRHSLLGAEDRAEIPAAVAQPAPPRTPAASGSSAAAVDEMPLNLEAAEDLLIRRALAETGGNIAEAARRLGVNRTRIYRKLSASK
jgi:DNA-binding NtrC family response regulator